MQRWPVFELLQTEHWRREHLQQLIQQFRQGAQALGLNLMDSPTPIQPIIIGDSGKAMAISAKLRQLGILVGAIRPPTVPAGSARLRITLTGCALGRAGAAITRWFGRLPTGGV